MHVQIYTKDNCTYCTQAKSLLGIKRVAYEEQKLGVDVSREFLVETFPNAKTFPIIIVDGFYIGGYTELVKKLDENSGNTQRLLTEGEWNGA